MHTEALRERIVDPATGKPAEWRVDARGDGELVLGARRVPVRGGIPRFVDDDYVESFGFQWNRFEVLRPEEDLATFELKTGVKAVDLAGLRVLDAGCGGGRYARVAGQHGAETIGADHSRAVDKAAQLTAGLPNVLLMQADLNHLPLRERSFDLAFSIGVLHHSPNAERAFRSIARLVRPGGRLSVWLYRRNSWPQEWINGVLRWLARRLPRTVLLALCRIGAGIGGIPVLGQIFSKIVNVSTHPDPHLRVCDTFDWYSPTYQSHHTPKEVRGWFESAGFEGIAELPPAKSGRIYRTAFAWGLIPGSGVNITGIRRPD